MKSHFNIEFAAKNLPKIVHVPQKLVNQTKASKMGFCANNGVLARLKIRHFWCLTVYGQILYVILKKVTVSKSMQSQVDLKMRSLQIEDFHGLGLKIKTGFHRISRHKSQNIEILLRFQFSHMTCACRRQHRKGFVTKQFHGKFHLLSGADQLQSLLSDS